MIELNCGAQKINSGMPFDMLQLWRNKLTPT